MKDLVNLIFLFVILSVGIYAGFAAIATIHSTNTGNCAYNASGSLVNCSLSDADFKQQNASAVAASQMYTTMSVFLWIPIAAILIGMMLLFLKPRRR